jgi:DNA processing protein
MTDQDLFYLLALQRVEGVGDIMAKTTYPLRLCRVCFKTKSNNLQQLTWELICLKCKGSVGFEKQIKN